jgi:hypothetical protein
MEGRQVVQSGRQAGMSWTTALFPDSDGTTIGPKRAAIAATNSSSRNGRPANVLASSARMASNGEEAVLPQMPGTVAADIQILRERP